jgi:hypothetical protein
MLVAVEVRGTRCRYSDDLAPSRKILHRTAKRIKFHTTIVVNSKLPNRNKVLNEAGSNKNIIKAKVVREFSRAGGDDRNEVAITNNNARRRGIGMGG